MLDRIHRDELYAVKLGPKTYRIPLTVVMQRLRPDFAKSKRVAMDARELAADERRRNRRPVTAVK